jgi:hypothetical protein
LDSCYFPFFVLSIPDEGNVAVPELQWRGLCREVEDEFDDLHGLGFGSMGLFFSSSIVSNPVHGETT